MKNIAAFLVGLLAFWSSAFATPIGNPIPSVQSAAIESGHILKASSGYLNGFSATIGISAGYIMLIDSATIPSNGAVTPKFCYAVPANSSIAATWLSNPAPFVNGIVIVFSTTGCFTQTLSSSAFFAAQVQ